MRHHRLIAILVAVSLTGAGTSLHAAYCGANLLPASVLPAAAGAIPAR